MRENGGPLHSAKKKANQSEKGKLKRQWSMVEPTVEMVIKMWKLFFRFLSSRSEALNDSCFSLFFCLFLFSFSGEGETKKKKK